VNPCTIGGAADSDIGENLMGGAVDVVGDPGRHPNDFARKAGINDPGYS
jgi:hypothetical protein